MTDGDLDLVEELRRLAKAAFLQRNYTRKHGPLIDEAFVLLDQRPDLVAWRARFLVERSNYLRTAPHVDKAEAIPPAVEALDLASQQTDPVLFALAARQYTMAVRSKETQADRLVLLFDALHRLEQAIETGYPKVYDLGPLTVAAQVAFRISSILKDQGRLREALEVTVRARSLPGLLDASPYWYAELMRRQSTLLRGLGLLEEHERFLDELDMLGPEVDDNTRFLRHRLRADEHERRQELAKAAARYRVALDELPTDKLPVKRGNVSNTLAFVSLRLNDLPAAEAALELADRAWLDYGRATTGLAVTRRHRSRIAALEGDWQAAVEQLLESVRILREAKSESYGSTLTRLLETLAEAVDANYDVRTFESAALATPSGPVPLGDLSVLLAETERVTDLSEQGLASRAQRAAAVLTMAGFLTGHEALQHALAAYEAATKAPSNGLRHRALSAGTVARVLESQGVDAMAWSRVAVEHLEQMRAQIDDEFDRARVANESRDIYLRAWRQAANAGDAAFAVRIAESARGTMIVSLLSAMASDTEGHSAGAAFRAAIARLRRIESASADIIGEAGVTDAAEDPPDDAPSQPSADRPVDRERAMNLAMERSATLRELREVSGALTTLLEPIPVDDDEVRRISAGRWVVYLDVADHSVYSATVGPEPGSASVSAPRRLTHAAARLLGQLSDPRLAPIVAASALSTYWDEMSELAQAFIPKEVQIALALASPDSPIDILIVPTGDLYAFPFSACVVNGEPILSSAVVTVAPSVRLIEALDSRHSGAASRGPLIYVDAALPGAEAERNALRRASPDASEPGSAAELRQALTEGNRHQWISLAVHGEFDAGGLHQYLRLSARDTLTVGDCMDLTFARRMVAGACWIGRVDHVHGADPIGLPIACMMRGTGVFVGGLFPISDEATGHILAGVYSRLVAGEPLPAALRREQLEYFRLRPDAPLRAWAGLVAIGSDHTPARGDENRWRGLESASQR